jgi:hypothetical protein
VANGQRILCTPRPISYFFFSVEGVGIGNIDERDLQRHRRLKSYLSSLGDQ